MCLALRSKKCVKILDLLHLSIAMDINNFSSRISESIASLSAYTTDRTEDEPFIDHSKFIGSDCDEVWEHPERLAVVITGCDSGFGKIAAEVLPRVGYVCISTCLHHKSLDALEGLYNQLYLSSGHHRKIISKAMIMDVTDDDSIENAVKETRLYLNTLGIPGLYALINNAGIWDCSYIKESSACYINRIHERDMFRKIIDTNLIGSFNCSLSFLPLLEKFSNDTHDKNSVFQTLSSIVSPIIDSTLDFAESDSDDSDAESATEELASHIPCVKQNKAPTSTLRSIINKRRRARVIFISSVLDSLGLPGQAAYCASKFAVKGLHESLRLELYRHGISSVIISPAVMKNTNLFHHLNEVLDINYNNYTHNDLDIMKRNLLFLKRFGTLKEDLLDILLTALAERVPNNEYRNTPGSLPFKLLSNSWSIFKDLVVYFGLYILPPFALFCLDIYHKSTNPFSSAFNFSLDSYSLI